MRKFVLSLLALVVLAHPLWAQRYIHPDSTGLVYSANGIYDIHGRTVIVRFDLLKLYKFGYTDVCTAADTVFIPTLDMISDTFITESIYEREWYAPHVKVYIESSSATWGFGLVIKTPPEKMDTTQYILVVVNEPFLLRPIIFGPYYFPIPLEQIPRAFRSYIKNWVPIHVPPKEIGIYPYPPEK